MSFIPKGILRFFLKKKAPFRFIFFSFFPITNYAQEFYNYNDTVNNSKAGKYSIAVSFGYSLPDLGYADSIITNNDQNISGFAKKGISLNLSFSYKITKHMDIMCLLGENINSIDKMLLVSAINKNIHGGMIGGFTTNDIRASNPHYISQYLIGPYFSTHLANNLLIELSPSVGLMTSIYPKITIDQSNIAYNYVEASQYNYGKGFALRLSIGLKYMLNKHIGVIISSSYSGSNLYYHSLVTYVKYSPAPPLISQNNNPYTYYSIYHDSINMIVGTFNITGGLVFSF